MATGSRFQLPFATVVDLNGVPLPGAQLFFYTTGTSTPANTYSDSALTVPNGSPVVANAAGRFGNIFLDPTVTYKAVLEDQFGNVIWTADPSAGGAGGATTPSALAIAEAAAPAPVSNAIILFTDDGETLKYKDAGNNVLFVQTAPNVANVGSFTNLNATVDAGGRVVSATSGGVASGVVAAEFAYSVASGSNSDLASITANTWTQRGLNTTNFNSITGCSLTSNQVTLPAGSYSIVYSQDAFFGSGSGYASGRLRNVTDSLSFGVTSRVGFANGLEQLTQSALFTIAGAKVFEVDMWSPDAGASGGLPVSSGENEVYVRLTILKFA